MLALLLKFKLIRNTASWQRNSTAHFKRRESVEAHRQTNKYNVMLSLRRAAHDSQHAYSYATIPKQRENIFNRNGSKKRVKTRIRRVKMRTQRKMTQNW